VEIAAWVIRWVTQVIDIGGGVLGAFVLIDALMRRSDAFVAADRQTKTVWLAITAVSALLLVLAASGGRFLSAPDLIWCAAVVAALVYLVDVRPKLKDIQRGTRW
jgi:Ca2+/H+ antiporter